MKYDKIAFVPLYSGDNVEDALANNEYFKNFLLEDGSIAKEEMYCGLEGLYKVTYRNVGPSFESVLEKHVADHPGAYCEIVSPEWLDEDGLRVVTAKLYCPGGKYVSQSELHLDMNDLPQRIIDLDSDGNRKSEIRPIYNSHGLQIGTRRFDATGVFLDEIVDDD